MFKKVVVGLALMASATAANAGAVVQSFTVNKQFTEFSHSITYNLFDTLGGTRVLDSVELIMDTVLDVEGKHENVGGNTADLVFSYTAEFSLNDLSSTTLLQTIVSASQSYSLTAFDGTIDFAGTSGITYLDNNISNSEDVLITDNAGKSDFIGTGSATSAVTFVADAHSDVQGGGNGYNVFSTEAEGMITIIYNYTEASTVSSPATIGFLLTGALALVMLRRRS